MCKWRSWTSEAIVFTWAFSHFSVKYDLRGNGKNNLSVTHESVVPHFEFIAFSPPISSTFGFQ